jgi:RNA polymerase sigma-70 factor (ECF subfamily)
MTRAPTASDDPWAVGRAAWPELGAPRAAFDAYVARAAGGELRPDDLYLACACGTGDSAAIVALESAYGAVLRAVVDRFANTGRGDELRQLIRAHLFVAPPGSTPKIAEYAGRGRLENWLRVAALRVCLNAIRGQDPARPTGEHGLDVIPDRGDDVELALLKVQYRTAFRAAFAAAVASLDEAERAVLQLGLVHRLTVDQLGAALGVHRATAARRLATARAALLEATTAELRARLRVDDQELESLQRAVDSVVDVSLSRLLGPR